MESLLSVKNLNKKYEKFTLENISFNINKGDIIGLIGENGAGKSTTIKALLNLIDLNSGEVLFEGKPLSQESIDLKEFIGVVFDDLYFYKELNPTQVNNICKNLYKTWDENSFYNYLSEFELPKDKKIESFSKGMKMKLNIAIAISHQVKLLILDEATTGLDPIVRNDILNIFLKLVRKNNIAIVISSHITSDIEKIANKIMFIHSGKILFFEDKKDVFKEYGKIICSKKDLESLKNENTIKVNELLIDCGIDEPCQILVKNKDLFDKNLVQDASLDDILLGFIRGKEF